MMGEFFSLWYFDAVMCHVSCIAQNNICQLQRMDVKLLYSAAGYMSRWREQQWSKRFSFSKLKSHIILKTQHVLMALLLWRFMVYYKIRFLFYRQISPCMINIKHCCRNNEPRKETCSVWRTLWGPDVYCHPLHHCICTKNIMLVWSLVRGN